MPRLLTMTRAFALILLTALAVAGFFKSAGHAAESSSAPHVAANDVQLTITTYNEGTISREVTVNAGAAPSIAGNESNSAATSSLQPAAAGDLVFSQIYSNGGNTGSTYQKNYLEIFNRTNNTIDFSGWRIYIATDTGNFNLSFAFSSSQGIPIAAHKYLLIALGRESTNGATVPADLFGPSTDIIIPGLPPVPPPNIYSSGKVFLTPPNTDVIGTTCPLPNDAIVDFVGYGTTANCFEGTGPAPTTANATADVRRTVGCTDTNNNQNDFVANEASPHNRFSEANNCLNPIDNAEFFVRQHYADFLNRVPDAEGLAFWINEITSCGADATCVEVKRINVSAAFFLSIEFQETGYLVERIYKAAYADADGSSQLDTPGNPHPIKVPVIRFSEFLADSQLVSKDVIVGQPGWQQQLENNKVTFTQAFVTRSRFTSKYPTTRTPSQFVNELYMNAGVIPPADELALVIGEFGSATDTTDTAARARALRRVAENGVLAVQEKNRAFVLMQYFGYLRRNPNDLPDTDYTGYEFWLNKLIAFNGNYINAEMVKAFISSTEYRQRF